MSRLALSWDKIHRDSHALAEALRAKGPFSGVVAVARGGLVPAALVAGELDLRLVETVCIASYDGAAQGELAVLKAVPGDGAGWVVVDDLVDSGATARAIKQMLPKAHLATLYAKPAGRDLADTHIEDFAQDTWIDFPWERDPS